MNLDFRSRSCMAAMPCSAAFSLLEMMIVCALVAVLLSLAVPAYRYYLMRVYRSEAIESLLAAAACQERIYANEFNYDTRRCLPDNGGKNYSFRFEPSATPTSGTFTIIAEPLEIQSGDPCGRISLDQSGTRGIGGPAGRLRQCWEGR